MEREQFVTTEPTEQELDAIIAEHFSYLPRETALPYARQWWRAGEHARLNPLRELRIANEAEKEYRLSMPRK